jgi:NADH:ubiquinone oxidoreductase subunit H
MYPFSFYVYLIAFLFLTAFNFSTFIIELLMINYIDFMISLNIVLNFISIIAASFCDSSFFQMQVYILDEIKINFFTPSNLIWNMDIVFNYLVFISQVLFIVIITIWTRAAGPRFRLDQLLSLTWKDLFIYLSLFLVFILILITIV